MSFRDQLFEKRLRRRNPRDRYGELCSLKPQQWLRGRHNLVTRADRYLMFWTRLKRMQAEDTKP